MTPWSKVLTKVALVGLVTATLVAAPGRADAATTAISSSGPLTHIYVSGQLNCQVKHANDSAMQFYYPFDTTGACGTFIVVDDELFGPSYVPAGGGTGARTPYTPVSQSAVTGAGTSADPLSLETVVDVGSTGLRIAETDTYVIGSDSYRTSITIENTGSAAKDFVLYRAGDCYLGGSDAGYGFVIEDIGAVACTKTASNDPPGRVEQWVPITGGNNYYQAGYNEVWSAIGSHGPFPDTCRCDNFIDNGAGISWTGSVSAASSASYSHITNFGQSAALSSIEANPAVAEISEDPGVYLAPSATLTDAATGAAITGAEVEFFVGSDLLCSGTTDANGSATCGGAMEILTIAGEGSYTAVFSGNTDYLANAGRAPLLRVLGTDLP